MNKEELKEKIKELGKQAYAILKEQQKLQLQVILLEYKK